MSLSKKVKTALDETRLLILGAQVLFGFKLHGVFHEGFDKLPMTARALDCAGQLLMTIAIALLVAPSMHHRIVENGQDTRRILRVTTLCAGAALLPFAISLGLSVYIIFDRVYGWTAAVLAGGVVFVAALLNWYALGYAVRVRRGSPAMDADEERPTPLSTRIEQMLIEARVILPGAQALLGFQLTVVLTQSFEHMPGAWKLLHVVALSSVAFAVVLLMTPAALHRIGYSGEDTPSFHRLGSYFVVAATVPLAEGITLDLFVATAKAVNSAQAGAAVAAIAAAALIALWFVLPGLARVWHGRA